MNFTMNGKRIGDREIKERLAERRRKSPEVKRRKAAEERKGSIAEEIMETHDESKPISSVSFRGGWPSPPKRLNNTEESERKEAR